MRPDPPIEKVVNELLPLADSADEPPTSEFQRDGDVQCRLMLREDGQIPGELRSSSVYVNGNVHRRGPGSTRKDPLKWYATLPEGAHRIVVRESDLAKTDRQESNTLFFSVKDQQELVIDVAFHDGAIVLSLAPGGTPHAHGA